MATKKNTKFNQLQKLAHEYCSSTQNPDLSEYLSLIALKDIDAQLEESTVVFKLVYQKRTGKKY